MHRLLIISFIGLLLGGNSAAQSPSDLLKEIRKIKLLESTRDDVKQILYLYEASDDDGHNQTFELDGVSISVDYATGTCSDDPDEDDFSDIWEAAEWAVTRIEVEWDDDYLPTPATLGLKLSKLEKEQMFRDNPDLHLYHDRKTGLAVRVKAGRVRSLEIFPPLSKLPALCKQNTEVRDFYNRKSWFAEKLEERSGVISCPVASVSDVRLSNSLITATSPTRAVSIETTASDPENDVLTYVYIVTGGRIIGEGPNVKWDLTGVAPGVYTMTAGVDDGCGVCGATRTVKVTVQ